MGSGISNVLTIFLSFLGSGTASAVILAVLNRYWKRKDEKEAKQAVTPEMLNELSKKLDASITCQKVSTAHMIRCIGASYVYSGKVSLEDKTVLNQMNDAYLALPGADGLCGTVMKEVNKLPISNETGKDELFAS